VEVEVDEVVVEDENDEANGENGIFFLLRSKTSIS
jgi:hypothetical protein